MPVSKEVCVPVLLTEKETLDKAQSGVINFENKIRSLQEENEKLRIENTSLKKKMQEDRAKGIITIS